MYEAWANLTEYKTEKMTSYLSECNKNKECSNFYKNILILLKYICDYHYVRGNMHMYKILIMTQNT